MLVIFMDYIVFETKLWKKYCLDFFLSIGSSKLLQSQGIVYKLDSIVEMYKRFLWETTILIPPKLYMTY